MVGLYFFACQLGCTSNIPGRARASHLPDVQISALAQQIFIQSSVVVCIFRFIHYPHTVSILYMMYLLVYSRIFYFQSVVVCDLYNTVLYDTNSIVQLDIIKSEKWKKERKPGKLSTMKRGDNNLQWIKENILNTYSFHTTYIPGT